MDDTSHDHGFTLIEALVTISLMSILMAIAISGWSSWAKASAHSGTAREIQSAMRQAQQRAVTEGRSTCVWFNDADETYTVYRGRCSASDKVIVIGPVATGDAAVGIAEPSFTSAAGVQVAGVSFHARGTGSPGAVKVVREGSTKVYTLRVQGLTGRVSLS